LLDDHLSSIKDGLRISLTCGTQDRGHLKTIREFHAALVDREVDHTYLEVEGLGHDHGAFLDLYQSTWFDYHVESFRRAAKRLGIQAEASGAN